jgi:hypothetical protein
MPSSAAGGREQEALGEDLADQPPARGADRRPDGHLALPRRGLREEHVRDVRAGDEQHEADRAEQDEERRAGRVVDARDLLRRDAQGPGAREGRLALERQAHRVHQLLRVGLRNARRQAPDAVEAARRGVALVGPQVIGQIDRFGVAVQLEAPRHDPDDGVRVVVEQDVAAEHVRVAAVAPLPDVLADDRHRRRPRPPIVVAKPAAETRLHAEHREEARRDEAAVDALGFGSTAHVILAGGVDLEAFEDGRLALPGQRLRAVGCCRRCPSRG